MENKWFSLMRVSVAPYVCLLILTQYISQSGLRSVFDRFGFDESKPWQEQDPEKIEAWCEMVRSVDMFRVSKLTPFILYRQRTSIPSSAITKASGVHMSLVVAS